MRGITLVFAALLFSTLSAQQQAKFDRVVFQDGLAYLVDECLPYTGKLVDYYTDGSLKSVSTLTDGKFNGVEVTYFDSGKERSICRFKDNEPVGKLKVYNEDGQLVFLGRYHKGILYSFGEDVPFTGVIENYYLNGQKLGHTSYKDGKVNGEQAWWTRDGRTICEYKFVNNVIVEKRNFLNIKDM